jgi:ribosomal protein L11 methyltransferase
VAELLTVGVVPLRLVRGPFDVVVANIGARVLQELAADLAGLVQARGRLVLSGLLVEQVAHVLASFPGWTEAARLTEDGWAATVLRPPGAP